MDFSSFGIRRVQVSRLFGLYDYVLPGTGRLGNLVIFYGDNGSGKTTLLKMVFHLLSPAGNRRHRGILRQIPFNSLSVELASGQVLTAQRLGDRLDGFLLLGIFQDGRLIARWDYFPKSARTSEQTDEEIRPVDVANRRLLRQLGSDFEYASPDAQKRFGQAKIEPANFKKTHDFFQSNAAHGQYIRHLESLATSLYLMTADRELTSDELPEIEANSADEVLSQIRKSRDADIASTRDRYLGSAFREAFRWIAERAVTATNVGSQNANDWYFQLIRSIVTHTVDPNVPAATIEQMQESLSSLDVRASKLAEHELFSSFNSRELMGLINQAKNTGQELTVERVLASFVNGLRARLDALEPTYVELSTLLDIVNGLFSSKILKFTLRKGFYLVDVHGRELALEHLSSGEKHLLLILFRALMASDRPTIYLVDEPEISLNVKWQRRLLTELGRIVGNRPMQLFFATHSIELLSQHSDAVAQLTNMADSSR